MKILRTYILEIISLVLLLATLILTHYRIITNPGVILAFYIAAVLPVAIPVLVKAWRTWCKGDIFNEFTLMALASLGAYFIGEYPEAVTILLAYAVGEKLEDNAIGNTRDRIAPCFRIPQRHPETGNRRHHPPTTRTRHSQYLPSVRRPSRGRKGSRRRSRHRHMAGLDVPRRQVRLCTENESGGAYRGLHRRRHNPPRDYMDIVCPQATGNRLPQE